MQIRRFIANKIWAALFIFTFIYVFMAFSMDSYAAGDYTYYNIGSGTDENGVEYTCKLKKNGDYELQFVVTADYEYEDEGWHWEMNGDSPKKCRIHFQVKEGNTVRWEEADTVGYFYNSSTSRYETQYFPCWEFHVSIYEDSDKMKNLSASLQLSPLA